MTTFLLFIPIFLIFILRYGFDIEGTNQRGDIRTEDNGIKTGRDRFGSSRYDWQGKYSCSCFPFVKNLQSSRKIKEL